MLTIPFSKKLLKTGTDSIQQIWVDTESYLEDFQALIKNFQVLSLTIFYLKFMEFLEIRIFEEGINSLKTMLRPQVSGDTQIVRNGQTYKFPFPVILVIHSLNKSSLYFQTWRKLIFGLTDDPNSHIIVNDTALVFPLKKNIICSRRK